MNKINKKVNLAIIGCGPLVYDLLYDCTKKLPVKLVAICDTNKDYLKRFSERYFAPKTYLNYKEMLANENIDAVISFPHPDMQFEVAKDCMLANSTLKGIAPEFNMEDAIHTLELVEKFKKSLK
jgi:predicted dehydrogenase